MEMALRWPQLYNHMHMRIPLYMQEIFVQILYINQVKCKPSNGMLTSQIHRNCTFLLHFMLH